MRVVLDTNVLVSGIYFSGIPARILAAWGESRFELLASVEILTEYREVVERLQRRYPGVDAGPIVDLVIRGCRLIEAARVPKTACDDPDDLMFLGCALAGRAACIVSGDRALLRASGFRGIEVITPRGFVDRFLPSA